MKAVLQVPGARAAQAALFCQQRREAPAAERQQGGAEGHHDWLEGL